MYYRSSVIFYRFIDVFDDDGGGVGDDDDVGEDDEEVEEDDDSDDDDDVHGHSCMKPAQFLFYIKVLVLVLVEDIILNCLSLSIVLICGSIVLRTGLSISGTACQVILLMLVAFLYLNTN